VTPVLAHGPGDPAALPLPLPVVLALVVASLVGTANRLSHRARAATVRGDRARVAVGGDAVSRDGTADPAPGVGTGARGTVLPGWVQRVVDHPAVRAGGRLLGVAWAVAVVVLAAAGPPGPGTNPAPRLVLVVGWAGLVPLSLVAPGAWRLVSPLRGAWRLLARLTGDPGERTVRPLPLGWGWWPAVPGLVAVVVLEARFPDDPVVLLAVLTAGGLSLLAGAARYGGAWFAAADPFEVFAAALARCSPVVRDDDGRLRLLAPWRGRLLAPAPPGAGVVSGVLVGAALADFLTDTGWWSRTAPPGPARAGAELGATLACCAVAGLILGARRRDHRPEASTASRPGHAAPTAGGPLLALVAAFAAVHYFAVLLIEGQATASQLATLARGGLDALATTPIVARYDVLPATLAAVVQVVLLVAPHLAALAAGHSLAVARYGSARAERALAPLVGLLAVSAVVGTALRFSAA